MSESKGKPLSGKVVLVTGGGRGIGRECALAAAEAGALVSVAATTYSEIEAVKDEINQLDCQALAVKANVTNKEDTNIKIRISLRKNPHRSKPVPRSSTSITKRNTSRRRRIPKKDFRSGEFSYYSISQNFYT